MKKYILIFCIIASIGQCFSQSEASDFTKKESDRPRDPRADQMNFIPNEVLVKFKDDVILSGGNNLKSAGISSVDQILKANGVASLEKLFPAEKKLKSAQILKDPTGRDMKIPSLHNIYRITVPQLKSTGSAPTDNFKFMEELKALPEVEYAEPNYIFTIGDFKPAGPEMTMLEAMEQSVNSELSKTASGLVPNDPLYNSQWGIPATNIDDVWNTTTGDATSIIGILDTGVDWQHPDLAANIWTNAQEIHDNGIDDDDNGLIDDIRGWDYINNDNNPMDDNSHGTHVAGIAAAVGNNGIGIAGANWKAKIMPLKVFQSSGKGDVATIAKAVTYAATKGATVINMSFGSYAESLTLKNALANAYATAVLVAAAGNDAVPIGPCMNCTPMYPGAYSFVFGVEANSNSSLAGFSNYDQDGPVFSEYSDLLNYELKAPGTGILSCVPGGNYREYNGTSMVAPLVAGAVSLYRKQKPGESQEMLFGNLINSLGQHLDLEAALNIIPVPKLSIVSYALIDTLDGDQDGHADAGETIEINVKVRNSWGKADSVFVGVKFQEFEDITTANIEKGTALIGAIGPYASYSNSKNQLQIKIQPTVTHDRDMQFILEVWNGYKKAYLSKQNITIRVEHRTELKGVLEDTLRLTSDKLWLVSNSFKIAPNGVLILEAGSHLKIEKLMTIQGGQIIGKGQSGNKVIIEGPLGIAGYGKRDFEYTDFSNFQISSGENWNTSLLGGGGLCTFSNCNFENIFGNITLPINDTGFKFYDCTFNNIWHWFRAGASFTRCNFNNLLRNNWGGDYSIFTSTNQMKHCNFSDIHCGSYLLQKFSNSFDPITGYEYNDYRDSCNVLGNFNYLKAIEGASINTFGTYWGTTDSVKISNKIIDFWEDSRLAIIKFKPLLDKPSPKAHACVWKVVVNGKDAQDEFKILDPLGVATHKFEVYFNRPMNIQFPPTVTMGVREPYNQVFINENGTWSADSLIYTVYKAVGLTANNGLNRIKVLNGKDTEDFDLVPESERFNVNIQTTASASLDFMATPSLGKVKLEWNNNDLADGLGFNMYRMEQINDSTLTTPVLINSSLIADTFYTDFAVTPNKKYYYYYKILRTNLSETDSSKVVSATPFTASKGDANGDLNVNALDISSVVSYSLNENPKPFIFGAADMNNDELINVLDVVNLANAIYKPIITETEATDKLINLYLNNDTLFMDAPKAVAALQFDFSGIQTMDEIQKLPVLDGFESAYNKDGETFRFITYSLSSKSIPAGNHIPLLKLVKGSGILSSMFSDAAGNQIKSKYIPTGIWNFRDNLDHRTAELGQNYPNPLSKTTTIPIKIYEPVDEAVIRIVNTQGQEIAVIRLKNPELGEHQITWNSGTNKGLMAYMLVIRRDNQQLICPVRKMVVQ